MNLFDIWARNRTRKVSEMIASSFLNYLLDPSEDHGLGDWFTNKFLGMVLDDYKRDQSEIRVYSEQYLGRGRGVIDGLIELRTSQELHLIGIEVKIHDKSSINISGEGELQIERYYGVLDAATRNVSNSTDSGKDLKELASQLLKGLEFAKNGYADKFTLVYIVPRIAEIWPRVVLKSIGYEGEEAKINQDNLCILPWAVIPNIESGEIKELKDKHSRFKYHNSISNILGDFLDESAKGLAPQINPHCIHFIRCLRYAAERDFLAPVQAGGKHAKHNEYVNALKESENYQWDVFDTLGQVVGKQLKANPRHTTIGIRYNFERDDDTRKRYGDSIFRVRTVTNYGDTYDILDYVQLEFLMNIWEEETLNRIILETELFSELFEKSNLTKARHADRSAENGKELNVYLLSLKKKGEWTESDKAKAKDVMQSFYDKLNLEQKRIPKVSKQ